MDSVKEDENFDELKAAFKKLRVDKTRNKILPTKKQGRHCFSLVSAALTDTASRIETPSAGTTVLVGGGSVTSADSDGLSGDSRITKKHSDATLTKIKCTSPKRKNILQGARLKLLSSARNAKSPRNAKLKLQGEEPSSQLAVTSTEGQDPISPSKVFGEDLTEKICDFSSLKDEESSKVSVGGRELASQEKQILETAAGKTLGHCRTLSSSQCQRYRSAIAELEGDFTRLRASVPDQNSGVAARPPERSCSQQARLDDITIDELAGYFENYVYIPRKMSSMAEMMYT